MTKKKQLPDETIVVPPDAEPSLPPGLERFKYAAAMANQDPKGVLVSTYCNLHDLIELLVSAGIIKLSELEALKKKVYGDFRVSQIVKLDS